MGACQNANCDNTQKRQQKADNDSARARGSPRVTRLKRYQISADKRVDGH